MKSLFKKYKEANFECCPYCGSEELHCLSSRFDGSKTNTTVQCGSCKEQWVETSEITTIQPVKG